jgi:flagellar capping protein FliD
LTNVFNNSDNTNVLGDVILNSVSTLVGKTKATDFADIGITLDNSSGNLSLDKTKLADALTSNPDRVKNLLAGKGYSNST